VVSGLFLGRYGSPPMTSEELRATYLSLPGALKEQPFRDPDADLERRHGKIFAITRHHLNNRHWNTAALDESLPDDMVRSMIEDPYGLVAPRRRQSPG
jgi:predicted DNA-binding protein (MmcQ/YjbR family)